MPIFRDDIFYDEESLRGSRRGRSKPSNEGTEIIEPETDGVPRLSHAQRIVAERRAAGELLVPVVPNNNRSLSTSFWGQAWNRHLIDCCHYESRMPRGRTLLRKGGVLDLKIESGKVSAVVAGSAVYEVSIHMTPLNPEAWEDLRSKCQGKIASLLDLLEGKLSDDVLREITDPLHGLFPQPREIRAHCPCPDDADLCEHAAAVLYAIGFRLDDQPAFLFTLRGVLAESLVAADTSEAIAHLTAPASLDSARTAALEGIDLSGLFGIDMEASK